MTDSPRRLRRVRADVRPLHPDGQDAIFQHPIKGAVFVPDGDRMYALVNDWGGGVDDDDKAIYHGVETFRGRCELGAWLTERFPDPKYKIVNHAFVEAIRPIDFNDEESAETVAAMQRIDMAMSVQQAGGACTICGAPNEDGTVDHVVGCEVMSRFMHVMTQQILDADGEPSLEDVVRAANEQIERMT